MQETVQVGNTSIDECLKLMFSSLRFRSPSHRGETWDLKHHGCNGICCKNHPLMYLNFKIWTMFHMDGTLYYLYPVILNEPTLFLTLDGLPILWCTSRHCPEVCLDPHRGALHCHGYWCSVHLVGSGLLATKNPRAMFVLPNLMRWKSFAKKTPKKL